MYEYGNSLTETFKCNICGAIARNGHLAIVICKLFAIDKLYSLKKFVENSKVMDIFEAQARGLIKYHLKELKGYICSEYDPDALPRSYVRDGVRREDLRSLTFGNEAFDIVITQTVFEHILEPDLAWNEIARVLEPSGYHIIQHPVSIFLNHCREM